MQNTSKPTEQELLPLTGEGSDLDYPPAITLPGDGGKFNLEGEVLPYPGNTFICHIDPDSAFYQSLVNLQDAIRALPHADCMAFLPQPSFHMTVFCGVSGQPLGADGWPQGLEPNATLESISNRWCERLDRDGESSRFSVTPSHMRSPYSIHMQAASDADAAALLEARQRLECLTGLVRGDLDSYQFHITLGYLVRWVSITEAQVLVDRTNQLFDEYLADQEPIELGPIEFCKFDHMHRFTPLRVLG